MSEKKSEIHLKVLIPYWVADKLRGQKSVMKRQLEKDHKIEIRMSKEEEDYYPGTTDLVCLLIGCRSGVRAAHDLLVDRMAAGYNGDNDTAVSSSTTRVTIKILCVNSTVSMIIGKGGEYVRRIKDTTGVYIQVSQKSEDKMSLLERCITVAGESCKVKLSVDMILDKIEADSSSKSCLTLSYAQLTHMGAVPSALPTGSPYALTGLAICDWTGEKTSALHTYNMANHPTLDKLKTELKNNGFSEPATGEVLAAVYTLIGYGLLKLKLMVQTPAVPAWSGMAGWPVMAGGYGNEQQQGGWSGNNQNSSGGWNVEGMGTGDKKAMMGRKRTLKVMEVSEECVDVSKRVRKGMNEGTMLNQGANVTDFAAQRAGYGASNMGPGQSYGYGSDWQTAPDNSWASASAPPQPAAWGGGYQDPTQAAVDNQWGMGAPQAGVVPTGQTGGWEQGWGGQSMNPGGWGYYGQQ